MFTAKFCPTTSDVLPEPTAADNSRRIRILPPGIRNLDDEFVVTATSTATGDPQYALDYNDATVWVSNVEDYPYLEVSRLFMSSIARMSSEEK